MTDRVLSVRLQLEIAAARRNAKILADDLRGIDSAASGAGKAGVSAMSSYANAAKSAAKATAAVGGVVVGGMALATAAVVKGGIAYNTLEQTSRAALTTVLGGASSANSQMQELREFGKTSPFPRQVWIAAQQQLLAFGMSAEKIIPTFQAVQDAVAAAGGGGQQISDVVGILAEVQSTGKVGADTLNELGVRGIDAATLIGEAMGKTAAQVREDISNSAISGVQFIDQLTAAMTTRFGGAAEGVKATWTGATDRIKGAVRDIGGLLASPLVDPTGGGAAVEWANGVADALRALEARLGPAVAALRERAEPAVAAFTAKLEDLTTWIKNADFGKIGAQIQAMLPAVLGVTAGFGVMGAKSLPILDDLLKGVKPLPVAIVAAAMASPELRRALIDLLMAAAPLIKAAGDLTTLLASGLGPVLSLVAGLLQPVIAAVGAVSAVFEALPGPVQTVVAALVALKAIQMAGWFSGITTALTNFGSEVQAQKKYAAMAGESVSTMGATFGATSTTVQRATTGLRGSLSSVANFVAGPWGAALGVGITLLGAFAASSEATNAGQMELRDAFEAGTGAITEATRAAVLNKLETDGVAETYRRAGGDVDDLINAYMGIPEAQKKVNKTFQDGVTSAKLGGQAVTKFLEVMGDGPEIFAAARRAAKDKSAADRDGANAAGTAKAAYSGLAGQLANVGSATDDVATRTQQLNGILTELFNAQFGMQQAHDGFQKGLLELRGAFEGNTQASTKSAGAADKYSDSMKQQAKIVADTKKQLEELAEAQREAEKEAAEAAKEARQRALDELFGKTFNTQATLDAFKSALAQAGKDIAESQGVPGSRELSGFTAGALSNRERMRGLVQSAQAVIQAERDQGARKQRIAQITASLSGQLEQQAASWGLNTAEVKQYSNAIKSFGSLANQAIPVDLAKVRQEFADQRAEIQANSAEQLDNARASAASAAASQGSAAATKIHTAALKGDSESAIENRRMMEARTEEAADELTQMHLQGKGRDEVRIRGEELSKQLMDESIQLGFTREDVELYTGAIKSAAEQIGRMPILTARAETAGAMVTVQNFVAGVNRQLAKIQKNFSIGVSTGSEYINSIGGGKMFLADGGYVRGPGGPREDKIPAMLSNKEFVVNARDTARTLPILERINAGQDPLPGFASGGRVDPLNLNFKARPSTGLDQMYNGIMGALAPFMAFSSGASRWAASQVGKPYIWGGVGPAGYDCSGFMSAITNVIQGRSPHQRRFATGGFPTGDFERGPGNFMIGSRRGNPGHMAGTLRGINVESRGSDGVVMGKRARGAFDSLFGGNVWHLKGYADGGRVSGDPPFDLISPLGKHFDEIVKGSYAGGTDYVPMDGLYQLHQGEKVVTASENRGGAEGVLTIRSDGSWFSDAVVDAFHKGQTTGRIQVKVSR